MKLETELIRGNYDPRVLFSIWRESLPELNERRIQWGYRENPGGNARLWLLKDVTQGLYVGCCAILPRTFIYQGREIRGGVMGDLAIQKKWRTVGPAHQLQKAAADSREFDLLIAFPNSKAEAVQLRAGFTRLASLTRFVKNLSSPSQPWGPPAFPRKRLASSSAELYWRWRWWSAGKRIVPAPIWGRRLWTELEEVWQEGKLQYDFVGKRGARYVDWRFFRHPYKPHEIFSLKQENSRHRAGYIVYFVNGRIAFIQDFFLRDARADLARLFEAFSRYGRQKGWQAISVTLAGNLAWTENYAGMGFSPEETGLNILCFPPRAAVKPHENFFLTLGDGDF